MRELTAARADTESLVEQLIDKGTREAGNARLAELRASDEAAWLTAQNLMKFDAKLREMNERAAEELRPGLTLVLVPSIALVSQSYREWERWREGDHLSGWRPLAVVSSSSVPASELPRTTSAVAPSNAVCRTCGAM